jgi:5-methylcytosine-specific restriction endonuclease McrA
VLPEDFDFPSDLVKATVPHYAGARWLSRVSGQPWHVDHILPLALGGAHSPSNLQVITAKENIRKGSTWIDEQILAEELDDEDLDLQGVP